MLYCTCKGGKDLKIHIIYDDKAEEPEITVICRELNEEVRKILSAAEMSVNKLTGVKDGQVYILRHSDVIYIDTVDKKIFIYTQEDVYETQFRLYELEKQLPCGDFFRANKSCIVGIRHIRSIRADIDGRLLLTMDTGDKLWVSRQYAAEFRKKIGM
ncbi:MAG: LytTR family transcriptional regulator DNA-binding domain-containing protein [Clostridia bacterium]|nr:LytTR family transcriptional regulator DNA-binding domain-containing protein [Clostridia bacterium]